MATTNEKPKPNSREEDIDEAVTGLDMGHKEQMKEILEKSPDFGVRKKSKTDQKLQGTGSNLGRFERFLVQLKLTTLPPKTPGVQGETILTGAKVTERVHGGIKKIEPEIVYGSKNKRDIGMLGLNDQFIIDSRTPIMLFFPCVEKNGKFVCVVQENDNLKAKSELILVKERGGFVQWIPFYFFEWKGGKTIDEQIKERKAEYEYVPE